MIRLAAIALMIPAVAFGQGGDSGILKCTNNVGQLVDCFKGGFLVTPSQTIKVPDFRRCAFLTIFKVASGETATGPFDIFQGVPGNVHLEKGSNLTGPIEIENCDGVVTIRTDGK